VTAPRPPARVAVALLAPALAAAVALKWHYSTATADDLRWILGPTAALVELVTGASFVARPGLGYVSDELRFVIAPSCAGINFLIVAVCALAWELARSRPAAPPARADAHRLLACGAAAYVATLAANAVRIAIGIALHVGGAGAGWLTGDRLHRLAGIAVYLAALLALVVAAQGVMRSRSRRWAHRPLLCYAAVTIAVPLANGAWARPGYAEHAAVVAAALVALLVAARIAEKPGRREGSPS
jgi:exosortase K